MTVQISRTSPIVEVGRGGIPSLRITKCQRIDTGTRPDDDEDPRRHGYTTSYTPTLIIAICQEQFGLGPKEIVQNLLTQAGMNGDSLILGVGWIGDTKTVLWATIHSVEAAETLQEFVVLNRDQERAGVEIFSVTYVYDD